MFQRTIEVATPGRGLYDITDRIAALVREAGVETGLCHLFIRHTSASLVIQENADQNVRDDLIAWFARVAPDGDPRYRHDDEGPDDMPSHIRTAITSVSTTIPIGGGRMLLGTWQAIYVFEHRVAPHRRHVVCTIA